MAIDPKNGQLKQQKQLLLLATKRVPTETPK